MVNAETAPHPSQLGTLYTPNNGERERGEMEGEREGERKREGARERALLQSLSPAAWNMGGDGKSEKEGRGNFW